MSRTALVTGASAGVGLALIKRLEIANYTVIGCARNIKAIEELQSNNIHAIKCDVSKEDDVASMFKQINDRFGGLDICVNNAGMASNSTLLEGSVDAWRQMFEVNVIGVCIVTQHAVKSMKAKGGDNCAILNVNSLAGINRPKFCIPDISFYSVTKHALNGATSALRGELSVQGLADKIRVMQICPGLIDTEFVAKRAGEEAAKEMFDSHPPLKIDDVVDCIMHALSTPKRVTIVDQIIYPSSDLV